MLPKKHRINKALFGKILKTGKNFFFGRLSLRVADLSTPESLFSFVVSSKVSKKSTIRNRLKRRARHIIKKNISQIKPGFGIAVFFQPGSEKMDFYEMERELQNALKKAKMFII